MTAIYEERQTPGGPDAPTAPVPYLKGRFALFRTADGGIHIAYQPDPAEGVDENPETQHIEVPGMVVALAEQMQDGQMPSPMQLMKMFRGLR